MTYKSHEHSLPEHAISRVNSPASSTSQTADQPTCGPDFLHQSQRNLPSFSRVNSLDDCVLSPRYKFGAKANAYPTTNAVCSP